MIRMMTVCDFCGEELMPFEADQHMCTWKQAHLAELMQRSPKNDAVNHPKHYTSHPSGIECIEITKHYIFQIGNAMKYLWRQGLKDDPSLDPVEKQIQDCEKAIWYINSFIDDLKGKK